MYHSKLLFAVEKGAILINDYLKVERRVEHHHEQGHYNSTDEFVFNIECQCYGHNYLTYEYLGTKLSTSEIFSFAKSISLNCDCDMSTLVQARCFAQEPVQRYFEHLIKILKTFS